MERRSRRQGRDRGSRTEEVGRGGAWDGGGGNEGSYGNVEHDQHSRHWHRLKLQALFTTSFLQGGRCRKAALGVWHRLCCPAWQSPAHKQHGVCPVMWYRHRQSQRSGNHSPQRRHDSPRHQQGSPPRSRLCTRGNSPFQLEIHCSSWGV